MVDLNQFFKQAQKMQKKMEEINDVEVTGTSGGGLVSVTMTCKGDAKKILIDPSLFKEDEKDLLEDLILAAFNDARSKAETQMAEEMSKFTGGLPLPPGFKM